MVEKNHGENLNQIFFIVSSPNLRTWFKIIKL
jgi:hypothetical protein